MITSYSAVGGPALVSAEMEQVSEAINLFNSLMLSSEPSSPPITEILELMRLEDDVDKLLEEYFS